MGKKAEKKLILTVYPHSIKKKNKETVIIIQWKKQDAKQSVW